MEEKERNDLPVIGVLQFVSHRALDDIYQGMIDQLKKEGYEDIFQSR